MALFFVLLRWNNFNAPLIRDEGEYAYAARLLLTGSLPYEHSFLQKPPMVAYSYALAELVAPGVFWFPRIVASVFAALATALLGDIARREFGPGVAMPAMWLVTPMLLLPGMAQHTANTEMFMLLPLMATIAIYVRSRHRDSGFSHWPAAGCLAAVTICYKYTAAPVLAAVLALWTFEEWRAGKRMGVILGQWLAALSGGIFTGACIVAPFLLHDGGKRLWECTIAFNRKYAAASIYGTSGLWLWLGELWRSWWILFLTPCLLVLNRDKRVRFWTVIFIASWLATAGSHYGQYYLLVMPFWALLASAGLRELSAWAVTKAKSVWPPPDGLRLILTGAVVGAVCLPDLPWLLRSPQQFAADRWESAAVFRASPFVAKRLTQLTGVRDPVFVAGSEPQILYYAHRFSPTRFDIVYPLTIPTTLAEGYQAEAINDLQRHRPTAIVLVVLPQSWAMQPDTPPEFLQFLEKLLAEKYQIVGGIRSDGPQDYWEEPMAREEVPRCNLVIFKRIGP